MLRKSNTLQPVTPPTFTGIPDDVKTYLMQFLDIQSLARLKVVNKKYKTLVEQYLLHHPHQQREYQNRLFSMENYRLNERVEDLENALSPNHLKNTGAIAIFGGFALMTGIILSDYKPAEITCFIMAAILLLTTGIQLGRYYLNTREINCGYQAISLDVEAASSSLRTLRSA